MREERLKPKKLNFNKADKVVKFGKDLFSFCVEWIVDRTGGIKHEGFHGGPHIEEFVYAAEEAFEQMPANLNLTVPVLV